MKNSAKLTVLLSYLVLVLIQRSWGHPQCLDAGPPYTPKLPHSFCTQYSDFGCCTTDDDKTLQEKYDSIKDKVSSACLEHLKDILCQECSPYVAHIFGYEDTLIKKPLPGLCRSHCGDVYDQCSDMIRQLTTDEEVLSSLSSKTSFCEKIKLGDVDYCYPELLTNPILNRDISPEGRTQDGCLCLETFAENLHNPVIFKYPNDGSDRYFVGEQRGIIYIYYKNKTKIPKEFMDIQAMVVTSNYKGDERGLLGMEFHPEFTENRKLYIYFSTRDSASSKETIRVSEYKVSADNPDVVDYSSSRTILEVEQPWPNHNGGEIFFGFDGYLYLSLGDGGWRADPFNNAQKKTNLLGKILRIDINTDDDSVPYTIPADNPFVNENGTRPEIYAYGLRNAWRCDLDPGHPETGYGRGRIICADVGQDAYEEIDLIISGGNYGWKAKEGFECFDNDQCNKIGKEELPIYAYPHSVGKSVTGGHVYRGCTYPNLQGQYIYGDYVSGGIYKLVEDRVTGKWNASTIQMCGKDICLSQNQLTDQYETHILSLGKDREGDIYILTTKSPVTSVPEGKVYKIVDPRRRADPKECLNRLNQGTTPSMHYTDSATRPSAAYIVIICLLTKACFIFL